MPIELDYEIAPCLRESAISSSAREFVEAARALGSGKVASFTRSWCVAHLFQRSELIFQSGEEPVAAFGGMLFQTAGLLVRMKSVGFTDLGTVLSGDGGVAGKTNGVEKATGEHYGRLFENFSAESYWGETIGLLRTRLERNGIEGHLFEGKSVLDAGCGGGRYTAAWRLLGARPALGVDISPVNVSDATRRVEAANLSDIGFSEGNCLSLPAEDNVFDVVFSNGVLHHTVDWRKGVIELLRVMKPGGLGWLYLIEDPGGLFWDLIEILRVVMRDEDRDLARQALYALGLPSNRVFYMLDHVLVPINVRLTPQTIEGALSDAGARDIRRLTRGTDFDRVERIYQGEPFAVEKFGVGENRYVFSK